MKQGLYVLLHDSFESQVSQELPATQAYVERKQAVGVRLTPRGNSVDRGSWWPDRVSKGAGCAHGAGGGQGLGSYKGAEQSQGVQCDWAAGADHVRDRMCWESWVRSWSRVGGQSAPMGSQGAGCRHGAGGSHAVGYSRGIACHREQVDSRNRV